MQPMPQQSSMPVADINLTCLFPGKSSVFIKVTPKENEDIFHLKKLIKEEGKNRAFRDVDAIDLTLWKVRMIMSQRQHN